MTSKKLHLTIMCVVVLALIVAVAHAAKGGSGNSASQGNGTLVAASGAGSASVSGTVSLTVTGTSKGNVLGTLSAQCYGLTPASTWGILYDAHGALQFYGAKWQADGSVKFVGDWVSGKSPPATFVVWQSIGTQDYMVLQGTITWQ
jgi:hypothetical protein